MPSTTRGRLFGIGALAAMIAVAQAQGVIVKAVGDSGTSAGLQVDSTSPNDANFISLAEISANVVNECGRTLLKGNIDIGENTETALAAKKVTQVKKGSNVKVTINQVNTNGTGPYTCDMDMTSNASGTSGQVALTVTQGKTADTNGQITMTVAMPSNMACIGASTGDVCTVRCRNSHDFGGCFAVQQTDTTPNQNDPANITTAQTLEGVMAQIQQNQKDLPAAIAGNEKATKVDDQGVDIAQAILDQDPAIEQSVNKELATAAASSSKAAATTASNTNTNTNTGNKGNKGNKGTSGNKGAGKGAKAGANAAKAGQNAAASSKANKNNNNKRDGFEKRRARRVVQAGVDFQEEVN